MAWNPSPEVAVAREASTRLSSILKTEVDQIIIVFKTKNDQVGYASYGKTKALCDVAGVLADQLFDEAKSFFSGLPEIE